MRSAAIPPIFTLSMSSGESHQLTMSTPHLCFVQGGRGRITLSQQSIPYREGCLLLLASQEPLPCMAEVESRLMLIPLQTEEMDGFAQLIRSSHFLLEGESLNLWMQLLQLLQNAPREYAEVVALLRQSLLALLQQLVGECAAPTTYLRPSGNAIEGYIKRHLTQPDALKVEQLAAHFRLSPSYFREWFLAHFGVGYRDYLIKQRIVLLKRRLTTTDRPLKVLAAELGYSDEFHLSRFFKQHVGLSPAAYRAARKGR